MDKWFHPTIYWAYDYLYMLEFKLNHVRKREGTTSVLVLYNQDLISHDTEQITVLPEQFHKVVSFNENTLRIK